jgi:hypothetical protein
MYFPLWPLLFVSKYISGHSLCYIAYSIAFVVSALVAAVVVAGVDRINIS